MNILPILSVLLGLISVLITLKFVKLYENLDQKLSRMTLIVGGKNNKDPVLLELQDSLNITDSQFRTVLADTKSKILSIMNKKLTEYKDSAPDESDIINTNADKESKKKDAKKTVKPVKKETFRNYKRQRKSKSRSKSRRIRY